MNLNWNEEYKWVNCIAKSLRKYVSWDLCINDLTQEGAIGMLACSKRYSDNSEASLRSYSYHRIRGRILDYQKSMYRRKPKLEFYDEPSEDVLLVEDENQYACKTKEQVQQRGHITKAMQFLTDIERDVISMHFFDDMNGAEIAMVLECSESNVAATKYRALNKLKTKLGHLYGSVNL